MNEQAGIALLRLATRLARASTPGRTRRGRGLRDHRVGLALALSTTWWGLFGGLSSAMAAALGWWFLGRPRHTA